MVDLFFVLSGFVIALSHPEITARPASRPVILAFLARRVARIYPVYIASTMLALLLFVYQHMRGFEAKLWHWPLMGAEVANALMIQNWGLAGSFNGTAWSISAEAMAYLLFPVLCLPTFRAGRGAKLALAAAAVALLAALALFPDAWLWSDGHPRHGPLDRVSHLSAASLLRCVAEFSLGIYACAVHANPPRWLDHRRGAIALMALATIAALATIERTDAAIVLCYVPLILGACGPGPISFVLSRASLHQLGLCSYSFYMLHLFVLDQSESIAAGLRAIGVAPDFPVVVSAMFAITLALAWPTWQYVERPSSAALRRLLIPERGGRPQARGRKQGWALPRSAKGPASSRMGPFDPVP